LSNILISGGCKNGKSYYAQRRAKEMSEKEKLPLYYLATMDPHDDEDEKRIMRHRNDRKGWGFTTIECSSDICSILSDPRVDAGGVFLLDSVTALMANEMFPPDTAYDKMSCAAGCEKALRELCDFAASSANVIFVSDSICCDALYYEELSEMYIKSLSEAEASIAGLCDEVIEVTFGNICRYR